jgi:hypothetical protein
MKEKLILKHRGDFDYFLVSRTDNSEALVASLSPDEEVFEQKLSKRNCDELFGVIDVEKLADEIIKEYATLTPKAFKRGVISGFNKAMELNKDKVFTLGDLMNCWNKALKFQEHKETLGEYIQSLQQPTEIEVEIEMEKVVDETKVIGSVKGVKGSGDKITTYKSVLKLDPDGCLILKRVV